MTENDKPDVMRFQIKNGKIATLLGLLGTGHISIATVVALSVLCLHSTALL